MPSPEPEHRLAQIAILIPGEHGAFHVVHRAPDGRLQRTFVRSPQVAVIPAQRPHAVTGASATDLVMLRLDPAFYEAKAREALYRDAPILAERYAAIDAFLREVGNSLRTQLSTQWTCHHAYLDALAGVIAVHLARNYSGDRDAPPAYAGLAPHRLRRVVGFVDDHIGESLLVRQLAETVHMSAYHFARMFRKATGQPPHLFVTLRRIERAKRLLGDDRMSLGDVGATVGFQTQSHFTDVFRRHTGVTPGVFRLRSLHLPDDWQAAGREPVRVTNGTNPTGLRRHGEEAA